MANQIQGGRVLARGSLLAPKGMGLGGKLNTTVGGYMPPRPINFGVNPGTPYAPAPIQQTSMATAAPTTPASTTPDIRDPSYWTDIANVDQYYGTQKAQFGEERRQDIESRDRALTILGEKEPQDIRKTQEGANKAGLFYSSVLGRDLGNLRTDYARQRETIGSGYTGRENLRQIGESALNTQYAPGGIKYREAANAGAGRATAYAESHPPPPQDTQISPSQAALVAQIVQSYPALKSLPAIKRKKSGLGLGWG